MSFVAGPSNHIEEPMAANGNASRLKLFLMPFMESGNECSRKASPQGGSSAGTCVKCGSPGPIRSLDYGAL